MAKFKQEATERTEGGRDWLFPLFPPIQLLSFFASLLLFALCGCYSHTEYTWTPTNISGPGWASYNGQAVWKPTPRVPELTGDVFVAVNTNGNAFIQFSKTLPFLTAQLGLLRWQVSIPSQKQVYSGGYPLPSHFAWLQLPGLLEGLPSTSPWVVTGSAASWQINNPNSGESLSGYLNAP